MIRIAAVHLWQENLLVHPRSMTTEGVWITVPPVEILRSNCPDGDLSAAVRRALAASRNGVAHPIDWSGVGRELLGAARTRSWRKFDSGKVTVNVEADAESLSLVTFENRGRRHGFVERERIRLSEDSVTGDQLGARVRQLLGENS